MKVLEAVADIDAVSDRYRSTTTGSARGSAPSRTGTPPSGCSPGAADRVRPDAGA